MDISRLHNHLLELSETQIAEHFALNVNDLRLWRFSNLHEVHTVPSGDWYRAKHNKVMYTSSGIDKCLEWLGLKTPVTDDVQAIVSNIPFNKQMIICALPDGSKVNVRVRDSALYYIGHRVTIRRLPGATTLFQCLTNPVRVKMAQVVNTGILNE